MFQTLVEEVLKIREKVRSLVVAMTGGEYVTEDARKLFEALCKGIGVDLRCTALEEPSVA